MAPRPPSSTLFPYTTLFRSTISVNAINTSGSATNATGDADGGNAGLVTLNTTAGGNITLTGDITAQGGAALDRKSTRLNSSHGSISYAVFCLKKTVTIDTRP